MLDNTKTNRGAIYRLMFAALMAVLIALSPFSIANGQSVVVTLENGSQFEGEHASVPEINVALAASNPYGVKPIVMVDDGLRRIFFPKARVAAVGESDRLETEIKVWQNTFLGKSKGYGAILNSGPFDKYGHRVLTVKTTDGIQSLVQGITLITPRYCLLESLHPENTSQMRNWKMSIGTAAVPTDVLRSVLRNQINDRNNPAEYLRIVNFFLEAERYSQAAEELKYIQSQPRFSKLEEEITRYRVAVRQAEARWVLEEIRLRMESGQIKHSLKMAEAFRKDNVAGEILAEFMEIQNDQREKEAAVDELRKNVFDLIQLAKKEQLDADQLGSLEKFKNEIETDLDEVTMGRLDGYRRLIGDNSTTTLEKVSLALSGWLMGSNYAKNNFAVVQSLYPVRDLVQEYLTTKDRIRRSRILNELESFEGGTPEYLAPMIATMKPVAPPAEVENYTGEKPIEFFVNLPGTVKDPAPQKARCLAHLPPEYNPNRKYPVVLTLKPSLQSISLESQLAKWCGGFYEKLGIRTGRASRHGYIVVAVDWTNGSPFYGYDNRTHAIVYKALRQTLRQFACDPDRVFLHGHGAGANAAFDIGISHPEHWAGVIGVSGSIKKYPKLYSKNKHLSLPVYHVVGQRDIASISESQLALNNWLVTNRFVDCVFIEYDGRGNEAFEEEMPEIIKWMGAQRRRWPDRSGFQIECKSIRPWDNYFWFFTLKGFPHDHVTWPELWTDRNHDPITIECKLRISEQANHILVRPANQGTGATLYLSPQFIDFDKKVMITGRNDNFRQFVKPNREVLLEDVRIRADVLHPYWAKIECEGKTWSANFESRGDR